MLYQPLERKLSQLKSGQWPWLITVLRWSFVKLPGKFHVLLCLLFQLHCGFPKSNFWLQRFIMWYRTDCVFVDKEQQISQVAWVAGAHGVHQGGPSSQEQGSKGALGQPQPQPQSLSTSLRQGRGPVGRGQHQAWGGEPGSLHPGWPGRATEMRTGMGQGQAGMPASGWGFGSDQWDHSQAKAGWEPWLRWRSPVKTESSWKGFTSPFPNNSPHQFQARWLHIRLLTQT